MLIDFNHARSVDDTKKLAPVVGTSGYMAPERNKRVPTSLQSECYSCAAVAARMYLGSIKGSEEKESKSLKSLVREYFEQNPNDPMPDDGRTLILTLLSSTPERRGKLDDHLRTLKRILNDSDMTTRMRSRLQEALEAGDIEEAEVPMPESRMLRQPETSGRFSKISLGFSFLKAQSRSLPD